jgi:hypothetical protein
LVDRVVNVCPLGGLRDDVALLVVGLAGPDNGGRPPLTDC